MNGYRDEVANWSRNELAAYTAHESARNGQDVGIILDKLGRYDQGVVDAASGSRKVAVKNKKKKS
jgi:hypothetical protein